MSKSFKEKLKMAGQLWKKAKDQVAEGGGRVEIDDGRYVVQLLSAEIQESKASSRLQIAWSYKFLDGDYKGKTNGGFDGLETEQNLMYGVGPKIVALGFDLPESIEEIADLLKEVSKKKPFLQIQLKTKAGSEFQNLFFNKVLDKDDVAELVGDVDEGSSEDEEQEEEQEEVEEVAEETTEGTLEIGMEVDFTFNKEEKSGKILSLDAENEKAKIKCDRDGKIYSVGFDKIEIPSAVPEEPAEEAEEEVEEVEEEEEEEQEEEAPKKSKKVTKELPKKGKKGKK